MVICHTTLAIQWAQPLQDGLDVEIDDKCSVIAGEWTVLITIDEPQQPADLSLLIEQVRDITTTTPSLGKYANGWHQRLREVERICGSPRRWWRTMSKMSSSTQTRRGLFNAFGHAFSFLFGTATESEIRDIQKVVSSLASNQSRIMHSISQFTTIVNHTYDEIQINRNQLNLITSTLHRMRTSWNDALSSLARQLQLQTIRMDIEQILTQLEAAAQRFVRSHEAWLHRKENLEAGRLTENILPPPVLKSILNAAAQPADARRITPIQWYYEHIAIIPIWTGRTLIYKTRLPVVSPTQWHFVSLHKWPMPLKDWQATLLLPDEVLRNTDTGELDVSPRCFGARPRVCRRGLLTQARVLPCLTRLLGTQPQYDPTCAVVMQKRVPFDIVHPLAGDTYVLITGGTELALRCSGRAELRTTLEAGVYKLVLEYPCSLHGTDWTLLSTFQRALNITLQTRQITFQVNATISSMFDRQFIQNPLAFNLSELDGVDRKQLSIDELSSPPVNFDFGTPLKTKLWHTSWLLLVVGLVVGVVCGCRHYRRRKLTKSANVKIELQQNPPELQQNRNVPLFKFRGKRETTEPEVAETPC